MLEEDELLCEHCGKVTVPDEIEYQFLSIDGEWYNACTECQPKLCRMDIIDTIFKSMKKREISNSKANHLINVLVELSSDDMEALHIRLRDGLTINQWFQELQKK